MPPAARVIAWAEPGLEALIRDAVGAGGFELVAVGSPDTGAAAALSESLSVPRAGELKEAVRRHDAEVLWLAVPVQLQTDECRLIRAADLLAISSEPPADSVAARPDAAQTAAARFVPLMRYSPGYRAAGSALDQFGERRCVSVVMTCRQGSGSLFARLYDAMDVIGQLAGEPEWLEAALSSPMGTAPQRLSLLRGHLTANLRFFDDRCACATASDRGGRWWRQVTILGEGGCLRIDDQGFEWISAEGETVDAHREPAAPSPGALVVDHLRQLLGRRGAPGPPADDTRILALCEAARLSCRTAAAEAPRKIMEMLARP